MDYQLDHDIKLSVKIEYFFGKVLTILQLRKQTIYFVYCSMSQHRQESMA